MIKKIKERMQARLEILNDIASYDLTEESKEKFSKEIIEIKHRIKQIEQESDDSLYLLEKYFKYQYDKNIKIPPQTNLLLSIGFFTDLIKTIESLWQKNNFFYNPEQEVLSLLVNKYPKCLNLEDLNIEFVYFAVNLFSFLSDYYFSDYRMSDYSLSYYEYNNDTAEGTLLYNDIIRFYYDKKYIENIKKARIYWKNADDFFYQNITKRQKIITKVDFSDIDEEIKYIKNLKDDGTFTEDYTYEEYKTDMQNKLKVLLKIKENSKQSVPFLKDTIVLRPRLAKEIDVIRKPICIEYKNLVSNNKLIDQFYLLYDLNHKIYDCVDIIFNKHADVEYNKIVLNDFFELFTLIFEGKYFWYNEIIELNEVIKKELIKILLLNNRVLYCAYANYQYDKNKLNLFLKIAYLYCKYIVNDDLTYENDKTIYNNNDLAYKYILLLKKYYINVQKENSILEDNIKSSNLDEILKNNPNFYLTYINSFPIKQSYQDMMCGNKIIFHQNLVEDANYILPNFNPFKNFLIEYANILSSCKPKKHTDESYFKLIDFIGTQQIQSSSQILDKLPDDITFNFILDKIKLFKKDDDIKYAHKQILDNKEQLYFLTHIGSLILECFIDNEEVYDEIYFNVEEIKNYCYKKRNIIDKDEKEKKDTLEKSVELCNTINAFHMFLKTKLDTLSSPENFAEYIKEKNKSSVFINSDELSNSNLFKLFNDIFENEVYILNEKIKQWDTYKPETVSLRFSEYFKNLKNKIKNLCNDTNYIFEKSINFITTGEAMYNAFIPKNIILGDYGSLAINYYKALECLINEIFYKPYKKDVLDGLIQRNDLIQTKENMYGYIGVFNPPIKDDIMLGQMIHFFTRGSDNSRIYMIEYFEQRGVAFSKMKEFINKVNKISKLRNNCAHPQITTLPYAKLGRSAIYKRENIDTIVKEQLRDIHELIFDIINVFY